MYYKVTIKTDAGEHPVSYEPIVPSRDYLESVFAYYSDAHPSVTVEAMVGECPMSGIVNSDAGYCVDSGSNKHSYY